jgi:hypothetical protein
LKSPDPLTQFPLPLLIPLLLLLGQPLFLLLAKFL